MLNPYRALLDLIPTDALLVGTVTAFSDGVATLQLPDGSIAKARGTVSIGDTVFFKGGAIEGPAPDLPVQLIEV